MPPTVWVCPVAIAVHSSGTHLCTWCDGLRTCLSVRSHHSNPRGDVGVERKVRGTTSWSSYLGWD
eukprot:5695626-Amphidinium_carterae.1